MVALASSLISRGIYVSVFCNTSIPSVYQRVPLIICLVTRHGTLSRRMPEPVSCLQQDRTTIMELPESDDAFPPSAMPCPPLARLLRVPTQRYPKQETNQGTSGIRKNRDE